MIKSIEPGAWVNPWTTDHESVGSMHPFEPLKRDDRDDSFDLVGSFDMGG